MRAAEPLRARLVAESGGVGAGVGPESSYDEVVSAFEATSTARAAVLACLPTPSPDDGPAVARAALTAASLALWTWHDALTTRLAADVRRAGGLAVICASLLDTARATDQLLGRCGRQGDPGETWTLLAACDTTPEVGDVAGTFSAFSTAIANAAGLAPLDAFAPPDMSRGFIRIAQRRAEAAAGSARREVKEYDQVVAPLRDHVYALRRLLVAGGARRREGALASALADVAADIAAEATQGGTVWPAWRSCAVAVERARALASAREGPPPAGLLSIGATDVDGATLDATSLGTEARRLADAAGVSVRLPLAAEGVTPWGDATPPEAGAALAAAATASAKRRRGPPPPPARGALATLPSTPAAAAARWLAASIEEELSACRAARATAVATALAAKFSLPDELPVGFTVPDVTTWEAEVALGALDDLWADFLVDCRAVEAAVALRAFSHLAPLDEFRLEASSLFAALLADYRWQVATELLSGPALYVRPGPEEAPPPAQADTGAAPPPAQAGVEEKEVPREV